MRRESGEVVGHGQVQAESLAGARPDATFRPETLLCKLVHAATCGRGEASPEAPDRRDVNFQAVTVGPPLRAVSAAVYTAAASRGSRGDTAAVSHI